jgi:hypothetical protein
MKICCFTGHMWAVNYGKQDWLAPRHSARKNTSLCSAVFPLLRSSSGLHNLFLPAFKTHKEKQQQINSLYQKK